MHNPWVTDHLHYKSHAMLKKRIHHVFARIHTKGCFPEHYSGACMNTLHACSTVICVKWGFFNTGIRICVWHDYLPTFKGKHFRAGTMGLWDWTAEDSHIFTWPKVHRFTCKECTHVVWSWCTHTTLFWENFFFLILLFFKIIHIHQLPQKCSKLNTLTQIPQSQQYFHFLLKSTSWFKPFPCTKFRAHHTCLSRANSGKPHKS